jgi:hypothetical protein
MYSTLPGERGDLFCCFQFGPSLIFDQSIGMANEYLVAPHLGNGDEAHESKHDRDALPRRLDELPDDLQRLVRKHTAANFFVEWHTKEAVGWEGRRIIIRYEFKLHRRLGDSRPMMTARITRKLDPLWRQTPHPDDNIPILRILNGDLEKTAKIEEVIAPFNTLEVKMYIEPITRDDRIRYMRRGWPEGSREFKPRLCFVRVHEGPYYPIETTQVAHLWSECPDTVLAEIGEKLRTVFCMELTMREADPINLNDYYDPYEEDPH